MKHTIWKFPLELTNEQTLEMPDGAEILCLQLQHGIPTIWAKVDPDGYKVKRQVRIFGTGHPIRPTASTKYVGTFQAEGGLLIFHVFIDE